MQFTIGVNGEITLDHEVTGDGPAVLLLAPGGMRSAASLWSRAAIDPRAVLADGFSVVSMDQRNAGASRAPVTGADGWADYTRDQLALMDHLGIDRFRVVGMCIGGPFALALAKAAPDRVAAAVLMQPIGADANRALFFEMFDAWRDDVRGDHPEATESDWNDFRERMFGGDFLYCLDEADLRACETPLLLFRGDDPYHPASISDRIAALAPNVEYVREWKEGAARDEAAVRMRAFLREHAG